MSCLRETGDLWRNLCMSWQVALPEGRASEGQGLRADKRWGWYGNLFGDTRVYAWKDSFSSTMLAGNNQDLNNAVSELTLSVVNMKGSLGETCICCHRKLHPLPRGLRGTAWDSIKSLRGYQGMFPYHMMNYYPNLTSVDVNTDISVENPVCVRGISFSSPVHDSLLHHVTPSSASRDSIYCIMWLHLLPHMAPSTASRGSIYCITWLHLLCHAEGNSLEELRIPGIGWMG
jgi:hypothetical protein